MLMFLCVCGDLVGVNACKCDCCVWIWIGCGQPVPALTSTEHVIDMYGNWCLWESDYCTGKQVVKAYYFLYLCW